MKALYRRYRPRTLSEVVGQTQITDVLEKAIKNGKLSHAYLFIGPRGTGKTSVARILAHEINGFKYELEDDYIDIIEIDAASNTGVDNIRDLRERAIIAPTKGKYKVYIIDEVHMLSKSAFNALLKTLEEPPEHVIFIMATTDAYKVPVTITSRSQVFTFQLADPGTMFKHLKDICKKEKIKITDGALEIVVRRGGGSFRDSLSLLDQVSTLSDDEITEELLEQALGLPQNETISQILDAYISGNTDTIRALLTKLADSGIKPETTAGEMINQIIARPDTALLPLLDKLTEVNRSPFPAAKLLVALCRSEAPVILPRQTIPTPTIQKAAAPKAPPAEPVIDVVKPEPKPAVAPVASDAGANEIWLAIIKNVSTKAPLDVPIINEVDYVYKDNTLTIYAKKKFTKIRLEKKRNLISEVLPETVTLEITEEVLAKDPEMAKIADIMGGGEEVEIDA
ncbi:DNA polymerase III subunit gamma/tau [Candidatus Saccharibacteria bacterium]|nr:DNA polymerase III subunit gamma/tau [Candidatus Saccharibacteria bacterium]